MFLHNPKMPRGIRNNNPGNIEKNPNNPWRGAINGQDSRFETFASPEWGIRAMVKIFRSYSRRGIDTVEEIISTWAPAHENDVRSYVMSVCEHTGLYPTTQLDFGDFEMICSFTEAIIQHENGMQPYDKSIIQAGVELGLNS